MIKSSTRLFCKWNLHSFWVFFIRTIKDNNIQFVKNLKFDFPISIIYSNISNDKRIRENINENTKIKQQRKDIEFK